MKRNEISIREYPAPATYQAENALLGMLTCNPHYIADAREILDTESFSDPENAQVWNTLCALDDTGEQITEARVFSSVNIKHFTNNILPYCQGAVTLSESYGRIRDLDDLSIRRRMYFGLAHALQNTAAGTTSEAIEETRSLIELLNAKQGDTSTRVIRDAINDLSEEIAKTQADLASGKPLRVKTSFPRLDYITYGGFARGNLVILAARPSVGKTAIALQMARAAAKSGVPTLYFSLEMTNAELVQRMIRSNSDLTGYQLANGDVNWQKFEISTGQFADLPLYLNDKAGYFDEICNRISTAARKGICGTVFIDYLGLISYREKTESLNRQIGDATKRLKRLAKDCGCPIVLLCQLNRDSSKEGRAPELYDLRDSGSIEQDADVVLMLQRQISADLATSRVVEMYIRKNRQHVAGNCILLQADDTFCNFIEIGEK